MRTIECVQTIDLRRQQIVSEFCGDRLRLGPLGVDRGNDRKNYAVAIDGQLRKELLP